ncbi:terminase small subunit [Halobacillus litoralis]|uniref:Terminase n=1 Tax=Halobacillus litoralis TaxID=45668 RepID=A0A410MDJ8_9BACI|nr:terminase small subunit [Halobacillus litoralis]QAS52819.1 terminase [Halobacillus litoralis]
MPRKRDPRRDKAFEIWKTSNGERKLKDIADELDCSPSQVRKWKSQDKWDEKMNGNVTNPKRSVTKKKETNRIRDATPDEEPSQSDELTDKQRLFCMHYVKSFNATMAAIKAGYGKDTAHVQGSRLLKNVKVSAYIRELKEDLQSELFVNAKDVLNYYVKIAFADITDYVTFTRKDVQTGKRDVLMNEDGSVKDIVPRVDSYNEMYFKNSEEVDGTIISEVKQGREGVSVKLIDKKWALEKLEKYFDLLPDHYKRKLEEEKLALQRDKVELEKTKVLGEEEEYEDDGFIDALDDKTTEVWGDD